MAKKIRSPGRMILAMDAARDVMTKTDSQLGAAAKRLSTPVLLKLMETATRTMVPDVRQALENSYRASGFKTVTGKLREVVATKAIIIPGPFGFRVEYAQGVKYGKGKGDSKGGNVYASASAKKYGAVYQPLNKKVGSYYRDLPTGELRRRKQAAGEFGDRAKRTLKKAIFKKQITDNRASKVDRGLKAASVGSIRVQPPISTFFEFLPTDVAALQAKFTGLMKQRLVHGLKGIKVNG